MNELTILLFGKPAPLPACVRRVDHGLELPKPQAPVTSNTDGQYSCASCGNWKPASEMHHRRDGRCGTVCIACTERKIALREKREELSDPAKVARRIAKLENCFITELRGDFLVYRKVSPPAYVGKARTAKRLLQLMRRVARND